MVYVWPLKVPVIEPTSCMTQELLGGVMLGFVEDIGEVCDVARADGTAATSTTNIKISKNFLFMVSSSGCDTFQVSYKVFHKG